MGNLQSLGIANYSANENGEIINEKTGRALRGGVSDGYRTVNISESGKTKTCKVHRLIATAFIPNPQGKPQVNHLNGNKLDNRVSNLEWATHLENNRHGYENGLFPQSKLTKNKAESIKASSEPNLVLAQKYGVSASTISRVKNLKVWG